jgi:hypothetical protein
MCKVHAGITSSARFTSILQSDYQKKSTICCEIYVMQGCALNYEL